ncbi:MULTISPECIES: dihydrofolate reductase family protein [Shouchella]|uniref:Dihydrofolate reductase family protein n=2 Tax=Shouchella TaxID=2893057 RepID=A0ABY7W062_9BACI|nr:MULTISPECIES: dihydrofolate reductase family protein [Shouchella]MED4128536.1 dihydrofolate reductase family protein [Shouchella miscanthi]WDF02347.1 dihydrofolate reductase family protein [Shouchella hunanensis]
MTKRKVILFIATSLDGYIATKEEKLDWLFAVEGEGDNGFSNFYQTVDTVVMGRKTFDWIKNEMDEYPYQDKESYVFTRSKTLAHSHAQFTNEKVKTFLTTLKQQEGEAIWLVGGGDLLKTCLEEKLVDEIIVTVAPKMIGEGIALFQEGDYHVNLNLLGVQTFNQFVELHYKVEKEA